MFEPCVAFIEGFNEGRPKKKMGKVGLSDQPGGESDRIPTFWPNFPKLNMPCNCP